MSGDLFPHGQYVLRNSDNARAAFPWCADWPDELKELFRTYVLLKQENNVLDYDDLLLYWRHLMEEPALAGEVRARFDHVLVDEYQDTNALQAAILLCMKPNGRGVTVVGDDAQSIYSFRAATVRNILDFPKLFAPPATVVTLEQNYRFTQRHRRGASKPQNRNGRDVIDRAESVAKELVC